MCFEDEGSVGKLDGRTAPITGGAKGPGRAIALLFAREGAYFVGACIGPNGGDVMV